MFGIVAYSCLVAASALYAQNADEMSVDATSIEGTSLEETPALPKPFFIESALYYYIPAGLFSGAVQPKPGFRGALGFEWGRMRLSFSSGYNQFIGTNPLILGFSLIPLTLRAGYMQPLPRNWGLQAELGAGVQISRITRYETELDLWAEQRRESTEYSLLAEGRLYAIRMLSHDLLKLYAGGGTDMALEADGPVFMPVVEAGVSLKPFPAARPFPEVKPAGAEPGIFWICPSAETVMYALSKLAYGGGIALGYGAGLTMGIKASFFADAEGMSALELNFLLRLYFLGLDFFSGPFVQFAAGPTFIVYDNAAITIPSESGTISAGLSLGWRFLLGSGFFLEPAIRAGYPYIFGGGISAGIRH